MASARRLGIAMDFSPCSIKAFQWTVDNIVKEGDNLILIIIRPEEYEHGEMQLWEVTGSPLTPLGEFINSDLPKKYEIKTDPEVLKIATTAIEQKKVVVLVKVYWGDAREKLCEAIEQVPLDGLTMGNRGLGTLRRAIMGSVSNYVVNNASCPVTVVKSSGQHH
ncbi:putative universal stress protein A [Medicago truncatula]|uniref:Putative universal stress protein A n=1 Tax=Medicago truncatula TaxID=3880 RepID=A2Q2X4_MEDTR|nr:universal stress protein PHOS32 [Medicago truncatula]ABN07974.1 Universal stress protein (Usp) [Medicago truncatula]AES65000.2 universal stress family protein [Medicago truncatula]RHN73060.1 putative universal stress protein A [Medicago truncatula]